MPGALSRATPRALPPDSCPSPPRIASARANELPRPWRLPSCLARDAHRGVSLPVRAWPTRSRNRLRTCCRSHGPTERSHLACARRLFFSPLRHGGHPCRSAASARSRASHRVGAVWRRPRSVRPTSATHKISFFNDVRPGLGLLRIASLPTRSGSDGFHARARSGVPLSHARGISSSRAEPAYRRRPDGSRAASVRDEHAPTSARAPEQRTTRRVNGSGPMPPAPDAFHSRTASRRRPTSRPERVALARSYRASRERRGELLQRFNRPLGTPFGAPDPRLPLREPGSASAAS